MSGRHQAQRRRYAGRHRAHVRHTGAISLAALAIVGAAGGLSASYALSHSAHHNSSGNAAAAPFPADRTTASLPTLSTTPSPRVTATPTLPASRRAAPRQHPANHTGKQVPLVVLRTLNGPSWIAVSHGGRQLIGRTVGPHQRLVFHSRDLRVTVGNAGAVSYRVGTGHPRRAGNPGEVRSFHL